MPFPSGALVQHAVANLGGKAPLAIVTIPAMLRAAVEQGVDPVVDGVEFGSGNEVRVLEDYFQLPRPRYRGRPFRAVWVADPAQKDAWQTREYGGKTLQRSRKERADRGAVFVQTKAKPTDRWALRATAGADLIAEFPEPTGARVRLVDLAIWFGRNRDVGDLDELLAWFTAEFQPARGDLIGTIYEDGVPPEYAAFPWVDEELDKDDLAALGSLPPAPTVDQPLDGLVSALEDRVGAMGFELPHSLVRRVLVGWLRGDIVVLVGQPGTGKTFFATSLAKALAEELGIDDPVMVPIRDTSDEAELIGYERLGGGAELRDFAKRVLKTDKPLEPHVVIFEEYNLATIESYLASVLVATQEASRTVRLPGGEAASLPVDAFLIATCNSFRDEPETRTRISAPAKRRSTIIDMPNVLWSRVAALPGGVDDPGFEEVVVGLAVDRVIAEGQRVAARAASGQGTTFDSLRSAGLGTITSAADLPEVVRGAVTAVARAILNTPEGRSWFTLAMLRDIALEIAYAGGGETDQLRALSQAVASKVMHQLRGPSKNVDVLLDALGDLAGEAVDMAARMKEGGALDELYPLL